MGYLRSAHSAAPLPVQQASCLETYHLELDYVFQTLQRLGARRGEIDDLMQDVFVILHRNWPTLDTSRPLRPWLFGVAFRVVRSHRRRRLREAPHPELDPEDQARNPEDELDTKQSLNLLSAALERVPLSRRAVLIRHDLNGADVTDIARDLSITRFGVYARLRKARKELASAMRRLQVNGGRVV
jgi:RNA polymerase sigma-70 factor (ECF subfamily)